MTLTARSPDLRRALILAALIGLSGLLHPHAVLAKNEAAYSSSMPQTYPKAFALWRAQLPHRYRSKGWAARFAGDARPIREVTLLGHPMLFFESCKPHLCTIDEADAVAAPDGDNVFGVILHNGRPIRVGRPTDLQMACLRAFAESYVQSKCCSAEAAPAPPLTAKPSAPAGPR